MQPLARGFSEQVAVRDRRAPGNGEFDAFTIPLKPEVHDMELADTAPVEAGCNTKRGPGRRWISISVRAEHGKWTWWNRRLLASPRWLSFQVAQSQNGACSGDLSGMGLAQELGYRTKRGVELEAECIEAVQSIATS